MFQGMKYVYAVYQEKSFSKAAKKLFISQPSLSAAVKKTEERLGVPLFDRSSNPIRLTDCGKEYIRCAERILDIQAEFENYLNDQDELRTGQLSIGASNLFASYVLPSCISHFTRCYPRIHVHLTEANTPFLIEKLSGGALDLVIDNETLDDAEYISHPLFTDQVLLAMPVKFLSDPAGGLTAADIREDRHKSGAYPETDLHRFAQVPFLLLRPGNDTRRRADSLCRRQKFSPKVILELDQQATAYHLSCFGMGAAFVSDTLIKRAPSDPRVIFFRLDSERTLRRICFYHKKGAYVTRAMEEFLKLAPEGLALQ